MRTSCLCVLLMGCGTTNLDVVDLTPTTLSSGLVAHWTFDQTEGTVLFDESGNRHEGAISGAKFTTDGRFGSALHFESGDSVTVDNFPYATSSWSFSAWVRLANGEVTEDFGNVVNTEVLGQSGWQFQTQGRPSGIYWNFTYWNQGYVTYDCRCIELGRWSHATVVRDATTNVLSHYVDGHLAQPPIASPPPILPGTSTLYMGNWMGAGRLFSGSIDDVAIYSRALSPAEVAELDMRPPPPPKQ